MLHGNTVYDVEMVGQKTNVMVTPDTLDDYWRRENKALLNEMDEITEERDMATQERDETEAALQTHWMCWSNSSRKFWH